MKSHAILVSLQLDKRENKELGLQYSLPTVRALDRQLFHTLGAGTHKSVDWARTLGHINIDSGHIRHDMFTIPERIVVRAQSRAKNTANMSYTGGRRRSKAISQSITCLASNSSFGENGSIQGVLCITPVYVCAFALYQSFRSYCHTVHPNSAVKLPFRDIIHVPSWQATTTTTGTLARDQKRHGKQQIYARGWSYNPCT